jgi:hypothetical protein
MKVIERPSEDLWQKYTLWRWGIWRLYFSRAYNCWGGAVVDRVHLDGTRIPLREYAKYSLSKGLSAPIGSVLVGDEKRRVLALAIRI